MDCSPWGRKESGTTEQLTHITHNIIIMATMHKGDSQVVLVVKNLPANAGGIRDEGSIPGLGRFPGGEHGNSLQYSCLENPRDGGAW